MIRLLDENDKTELENKIASGGGGSSAELEQRLAELENAVSDINYEAIAISSFSANPSTAELNSMVSSVTLSWKTNKTPTSLTFDGVAIDASSTSKTVTGTFTSAKTWTLAATDERGATATKTATLSFLNAVYYGAASAAETYDSYFVRGLGNKNLRSSKLTSFSVNADSSEKYIYYCLPTRMGTCSFNVGGFDGGFSLIETISFENEYGYTENYYIYQSDNAGLGQTTVKVS